MSSRNRLVDLTRLTHAAMSSTVSAVAVTVAAMFVAVQTRVAFLRREPEAGYTTETVVVTAALIVLALIVLAILAAKVVAKATGITL